MKIARLSVFTVLVAACLLSVGCNTSAPTGTGAAQLSAADEQKRMEASRKAQIDFQSAQINSSNLPPDQKQRMLEQLRSSAGK